MRRPAIVIVTAIGAAAAAAAALATASPAQPAGPPTGELHLVARAQSVTLVDNPPRQHGRHHPPSRGDGLVLIEKVFDPATGDRIGRTQTACTVIDASHSRLQCTGTVVLPQGEIAIQGDGQAPHHRHRRHRRVRRRAGHGRRHANATGAST